MIRDHQHVAELSEKYGVNEEDIFFIALNACGVKSDLKHPRMRFRLRLLSRPEEQFFFILALGRTKSPFELKEDRILFRGELFAYVDCLEDDDAVISYFRKGQKVLTLNSNARSQCTGCIFCPNTLEDASDPRLAAIDDLERYFAVLEAEFGRPALQELEKTTVCTGCFHEEEPALEHLERVRRVLDRRDSKSQIHFLSSVLKSAEGLDVVADKIAPFHLTLTIECFTNRSVILKQSKANLQFEEMCQVLQRSKERGFDTDFTYIVGLDPEEESLEKLRRVKDHVTTFPRLQVYQAHNSFMQYFAAPEATNIEFFLRMRKGIEDIFIDTDMRPQSWENYRPLWYFTFAGEELNCARV